MAEVVIGKIKIPYPMKMGMAYRVVKLPKNVVENHSTDFTLSYEMYSGSSQKKASASKSFPLTDLFSGYNPGFAYDYGMTVELTKVEFDSVGNVMFYFMLGGLTEADGAKPKVFTVPAKIGTDTPVLLDYHVDFHDAYVFPDALKTAGKIEYATAAGTAGTAESANKVNLHNMLVDGVPHYRTAGIYITTISLYKVVGDIYTSVSDHIPVMVVIEPGWVGNAICSTPFRLPNTNLHACLVLENYAFKELLYIETSIGKDLQVTFNSNYCVHTYTP